MTLKDLTIASTKRVEEQNHTCYWTADGYKFDNSNLALWYEKENKSFVTYVDSQIDTIRGQLQTPIDMEFDYNLQFLRYLQSTYETVNLFFSGGADSLTILELAIQNNIQFDTLICQTCDDINLECNREIRDCALPIVEKHKDKFGQCIIHTTSWDEHADRFSDELSFFVQPTPNIVPFRSDPDSIPKLNEPNVCYISGKDKPHVVFYNNKWYAVLVDNQNSLNKCNPNLKAFWLDAFNIKSYVRDAILFKHYLLENNLVKHQLQFFHPNQDQTINSILGRSEVHNFQSQLLKKRPNTKYRSSKNAQRITDAVSQQRMDVLVNYFTAMKNYNMILPEYAYKDTPGKFAWFIDLNSLEVFTQKQLIPNGF